MTANLMSSGNVRRRGMREFVQNHFTPGTRERSIMWDSDAPCHVAGCELPLCGYVTAISLGGIPGGVELPMICVPKEIAT